MSEPIKVLFSQANIYKSSSFLPNVWSLFKAHCDLEEDLRGKVEWLAPISFMGEVRDLLDNYESVDVLALSSYTWNRGFNTTLVDEVKKRYPNCKIVAGGPDIDFSQLYSGDNSWSDYYINGDGETLFPLLLKAVLEEDFSGILKSPFFGVSAKKSEPKKFLNSELHVSHLINNFHELKKLTDVYPAIRLVWETNRGCPYSCSFCNWGSSTMSKLRLFPETNLFREIELIADLRVDNLLIADGNFGILPRDISFARKLAEVKNKTGYPRSIIYSESKVNEDRCQEISQIFFEANLIKQATYGLQHNDLEVMQNMKRSLLSKNRRSKKVEKLEKNSIPVSTSIIIGSPGDDFEKLISLYDELFSLPITGEYRWFLYQLISGSPASNPTFLQKNNVKTVKRPLSVYRRKKVTHYEPISFGEYIIETYSYNRLEWVKMYLFASCVEAFLASGFLQFILTYISKRYNRKKSELLKKLFEGTLSGVCFEKTLHPFLKTIEMHMIKWSDPQFEGIIFEEIEVDFLNGSESTFRAEEAIYFFMLNNFSDVYDDVFSWFSDSFGVDEEVLSLFEFQKRSVININQFKSQFGIIFEWDWVNFFAGSDKSCRPTLSKTKLDFILPKHMELNFLESSANLSEKWVQFSEKIFGSAHDRVGKTMFEVRKSEFNSLPIMK